VYDAGEHELAGPWVSELTSGRVFLEGLGFSTFNCLFVVPPGRADVKFDFRAAWLELPRRG
jgi:hypothetical protein